MSKKLHRLIWAEWGDHQPEVHSVWEAHTIPSIEQGRELAETTIASEKLSSTEVVTLIQ